MSWHFLQGQEAASWAEHSLDGAPSALLSLIPLHETSCLPDSGTDICPNFQSGMTFAPSMASPGAEECKLSAAGSLAPTSVQPADGPGLTANIPAFGERWHVSLARYDRTTHLWKTPQLSLFGGLTECLATWPTWGLMLDGECWALATLDFPTREKEHGSWPTPKARDWRSGGTDPAKVQARIDRRKNQGVIDLPDAAVHRLWVPGFSGLLNPSFSEALMGWPIGWTECEQLAMDKYQLWRQQHGAC
jgi:hypothetical protein